METNLYSLFITLSVGALLSRVFVSLLLWLFLFPLRKNAGGFHAETRKRCYLISSMALIMTFILFNTMKWNNNILCFIIIISYVVICYMAPVESLNKPLEISEEKIYKKRTRIILIVEAILILCAYFLNFVDVLQGASMSCFIVAISLIAGKIKNAIFNKTDKNNLSNGNSTN